MAHINLRVPYGGWNRETSLSNRAQQGPDPDDFLAIFYQNFWVVIKPDFLDLFGYLHVEQQDLFRLNFGEII
jgi:hypothetical protein